MDQYKVRQCSQCQEDTEFYCNTCKHDLCLQCKEKHVIDLDTKYHDVMIYREKYGYISKQETCVRHPDRIYKEYCYSCELPVCFKCRGHPKHKLLDIGIAYKINRHKYREIIHKIRNETLYSNCCLMIGIKTCQAEICNRQSELSKRAQRLTSINNTEIHDAKIGYRKYIHRFQTFKKDLNAHLVIIEKYQHKFRQSAKRPVKFLFFLKKICVSKIKNTPKFTQHVLPILTKEINFEDLIMTLSNFEIIYIREIMGTGKRQVNNKYLLKLMPTPVMKRSFTAKGVSCVKHITIKTPEEIWISDINNLNLTNTVGDILCQVPDISSYWGVHTVNMTRDLIYIDKNHHIVNLSQDNTSKTTLVKKTESWEPQCIQCSTSNGDLLVGMWNTDTFQGGKVVRYSEIGQHIQTMQHNSDGQHIYCFPRYITENWNGDVIVSDFLRRAVVVVDYEGRHRFSYTGPETGVIISPYGVCTDALSHILICDQFSNTVQMIDKDGNFLSVILTQEDGINKPCSLSYDEINHLLWVASINTNSVCVYRHISRQNYTYMSSEL